MSKFILFVATLFSSSAFADATTTPDDSVLAWASSKDVGVSKSNYRQYLLEATDGEGNMIGSLKRYTWANSSFAHYVSKADGMHVEIEWKRGAGYEIYENGTLTTDGYVSPEAALLILRLNEQIEQTNTRIPRLMVNTVVDCTVAWNGYGAEISSCYVTPVIDLP
jgi:hypothetical protein